MRHNDGWEKLYLIWAQNKNFIIELSRTSWIIQILWSFLSQREFDHCKTDIFEFIIKKIVSSVYKWNDTWTVLYNIPESFM